MWTNNGIIDGYNIVKLINESYTLQVDIQMTIYDTKRISLYRREDM